PGSVSRGYGAPLRSERLRRRRLVDDEPEQPELLDDAPERVEADRLLHVRVDAELVALDEIAFLLRRGHYDDGDRLGPGIVLDHPQDLEAVDFRQFEIEQDQPRRSGVGIAGAVKDD